MHTHLVLGALLLLSSTALADIAAPVPARVATLANLSQPWVGRISLDDVKLLPRSTRSVAPAGALNGVYWGAITDDKAWRALVAKEPRVLGGAGAIDFATEAVLFLVHDTIGGGGGLTVERFARDRSTGALQLAVAVMPATLDIAFASNTVLMVRIPRAEVGRVQLIANGARLV